MVSRGEKKTIYEVLMGKSEGSHHFEGLWVDIKIVFKRILET